LRKLSSWKQSTLIKSLFLSRSFGHDLQGTVARKHWGELRRDPRDLETSITKPSMQY